MNKANVDIELLKEIVKNRKYDKRGHTERDSFA